MSEAVSVWSLDMSDVSATNTIGAMNSTASTLRTVCSAIQARIDRPRR